MQAMKDAKLNPSDIDEVVLVGGSTRVPKVQRLVKEFFGWRAVRNRREVAALAGQPDRFLGDRTSRTGDQGAFGGPGGVWG